MVEFTQEQLRQTTRTQRRNVATQVSRSENTNQNSQKITEEQKAELSKTLKDIERRKAIVEEEIKSLPKGQKRAMYQGELLGLENKRVYLQSNLSKIQGGGYFANLQQLINVGEQKVQQSIQDQVEVYKDAGGKRRTIYKPSKEIYVVEDKYGNKMSVGKQEMQKVQQKGGRSVTSKESYNPFTQTYISPEGNPKSMIQESYNTMKGKELIKKLNPSKQSKSYLETKGINEVYDPNLRAYVKTGTRGTLEIRPPTLGEKKNLYSSDNIFLANIKDIEEQAQKAREFKEKSKNIEKISKELKELEKGNIKDKEWIGSEKDYKSYEKKYKEYNLEFQLLRELGEVKGDAVESPKGYTAGFSIFKQEVPLNIKEIQNLRSDDPYSKLALGTTAFRLTSKAVLGGLAEKGAMSVGLTDTGLVKIPEYKQNVTIPPRKQTVEYNTLTGNAILKEEITIPEQNLGTVSQIKKVGEFVGETAPYFIPYFFLTEVGAKTTSSVYQEKNVVKGGIRMVSDYPIESVVGIGVTGLSIGRTIKPTVEKGITKTADITKQQTQRFIEFEKGMVRQKKAEGRFAELELLYKKKKKKKLLDLDNPLTQVFIEEETKRAKTYEGMLGEIRKAKTTKELKELIKKVDKNKLSKYEKEEIVKLTSSKYGELTGETFLVTDKGIVTLDMPKSKQIKAVYEEIKPQKTEFRLFSEKLPTTKVRLKSYNKQKVYEKQPQKLKLLTGLKQTEGQKAKQELSSKQILESLISSKEKQSTKQLLKQKLKQKSKTEITQKLKTPQKIKKKFRLDLDLEDEISTKKISSKNILDEFKVFVRKSGKDVEVDEFETISEAKKVLKGELLGTLRAGGFITRRGKKVKVDLGRRFRPSKIEPLRVVQKRSTRLLGKAEQREAQFFRKGGKFDF